MRIAFLILTAYESAGTEHAVITQANALAAAHDVEILSVLQTRPEPHFRLDPRVRLTPLARDVDGEPAAVEGSGPVSPEEADALRRRDSRLVPRAWDPTLNGLCDPALEEHLPRVRADVVVTVTPALLAVATQLLPPGTRVVHQEHRASAQRSSGMTPLLAFAPRADLVAVLTDGSRQWLEEELGPTAPPVVTVPNALPPVYRPRSLVDQPLIVTAGRLVAEKRFDHLVEAFGMVADRIPDWRLRIFGSGPQRHQLLALSEQLGLYDRVELPGVSSDMPSQWGQAALCALTSRGPEGLPLVLQEALAAGVPLVSYDCPSGPRDLVEHGTNGLLVPSGSVEGMAEALLRLAQDDELRRTMGRAALASAGRYDSAMITATWEDLFARVVDPTSSRRSTAGRATRAQLREQRPDPGRGGAASGGRVGRLTPAEARTEVLRVASGAAARSTDRWFTIPGRGRELTSLAVPTSARDAFLAALADAPDLDLFRLRDPGHEGWHERTGPVRELAAALRRDATPRVVLEPWPDEDGVPTPAGRRCGVEIGFWMESGEDLVAPAPGRIARLTPQEQAVVRAMVDGVEVSSTSVALMRRVDDVVGPVDVVIPWTGVDEPADGSGGLLRHQLRSLHYHAPWVRTVHVLAPEGRVPGWLDTEHPSVRVVPHDRSPQGAVRAGDARGLDSGLLGLPDLSERLVYLPPGVLLTAPIRAEVLLGAAGAFRVALTGPDAPDAESSDGDDDRPATDTQVLRPSEELVRRDLGLDPVRTRSGTLLPLSVPVLREAADRWHGAEGAVLAYLAQQLGIATGRAYPMELRSSVIRADMTAARALRALPGLDADTVCLELVDEPRLPPRVRESLSTALETMLPRSAPWER